MNRFLILLFFPFLLHAESYTFSGGKNNLAQIIAAKVLTTAYNKAGIQIKPIFQTLEASLQNSNAGKTDGELARISAITRFAPNLRKVPVPINIVEAVAFSKDTSINIKNWDELRNYKVTIVQGAKFIENATKNIDRNMVSTFAEALDLLQADKTEIVVIPKLASINLIYKKNFHNIKAVSGPLESRLLYHFVHKKNIHLIPIITPILQAMQESGEISFIKKAYLIKAARQISGDV
jgi:ABC-type amino acid transport substrate-binding protein